MSGFGTYLEEIHRTETPMILSEATDAALIAEFRRRYTATVILLERDQPGQAEQRDWHFSGGSSRALGMLERAKTDLPKTGGNS